MKVLHAINSGGFGIVERVELPDGKHAARKTLKPRNATGDTPKMRRRFQREVAIQGRPPPGIVIPVLQTGLDSDPPWYLMELAGSSLMDQILIDRSNGLISQKPILDLLDALEWIHELDLVHRDLKPQNVLSHDGRWKLSDFGMALPLTDASTTLTQGTVMGSPYYMAPEQASGFHFVDARADIYSVGCILYDWVVGTLRTPVVRCSPGSSMC